MTAIIVAALLLLNGGGDQIPGAVAPFPIRPNDMAVSRTASPSGYFDKIGRRAAVMGLEGGSFEAWIWPWKPLRNFDLSFVPGASATPIPARDIVREVTAAPEMTTLTYTYESFTVREMVIVPRNEPGIILLLDCRTTVPLKIIAGFIPVMQPMWPAGIGGQFSYWDDDAHGYVISEGRWRAAFICGSPGAAALAAPPAHMFADAPLQMSIDLPAGASGLVPIVIAGAIPDSATHRMSMDSVTATYKRLCGNPSRYYNENADYYSKLRNETISVVTADKQFNLAYEWGKVALDNLLITNPVLGDGMVAGYGLSGSGGRPGFAWFFGGDAFINALALDACGMYGRTRDALAFTQKWQRGADFPVRRKSPSDPPKDVGKMAHELSQSDGELCDWWNDYHYGYNHADTTPWYIVAMADYVRTSGDTKFLMQSWPSVKRAYDWCLSKDSDGDGLMDLKGAGLGALEFGKLVGIYADAYTSSVWVQAVSEMRFLARVAGDSAALRQAEAQLAKANPELEKKFWLPSERYYSYGATAEGKQVHEMTPWAATGMMFGLFDPEHSAASLEAFAGGDLCTDWGVRSLAASSQLFDPTNYNYGAVWPFISSFFTTAQFRHHFAVAGMQTLEAASAHAFDHAIGEVPEVFSGAMNEKLAEGYHHQGFSTTGYLLPFVRGLLGLEVDEIGKKIRFAPHPQSFFEGGITVKNVRVGRDTVGFELRRVQGGMSDTIILDVTHRGPGEFALEFSPGFEPGTIFPGAAAQASNEEDIHLGVNVDRNAGARIAYRTPLRYVVPAAGAAPPGASNSGLRVISRKSDGHAIRLLVEGVAGRSYDIPLVSNGELPAEYTRATMPPGAAGKFVRKEIVVPIR